MTDECNFNTRPTEPPIIVERNGRTIIGMDESLVEIYVKSLKDRIAELETFIETQGLDVPK